MYETSITTTNLPSGTYLIRVTSKAKTEVQKIIIAH
ncbi:MAG: T9SS type A sorting domain-containing protein [Lewinellaceae bacterium]|nr:T9SS type A sorting domain-containing protein [Lewinellaceae bacterium]